MAALAARLGASGVRLCDVELIEQIAALECLKNAAASLQARAAVELRRLRESEAAAAGQMCAGLGRRWQQRWPSPDTSRRIRGRSC